VLKLVTLLPAVLSSVWLAEPLQQLAGQDQKAEQTAGQERQDQRIPDDLRRQDTKGFLGVTVAIEGSTHPELIPEHALWQALLNSFSASREQHPQLWEQILKVMDLSKSDRATLETALTNYNRLRNDYDKRLKDRAAMLTAEGKSFADKESFDMVLESREAVLKAAERLIARLSPEGQLALDAYKANYLKHLTVHVPEKAWREYQLPR
jgi:hypothetical protein